MSDSSYDAIIIGAGIGGLVCGCYLAKAGMKVLICEQHNKPGGYCTSFRRGPFIFDAAAHSFGSYREGGVMRRVLEILNLNEKLKIKRYTPSDIIISPEFKMIFSDNIDTIIKDLQDLFPEEKTNIKKFIYYLICSRPENFTVLRRQTYKNLLDSYFNSEKLKAIFSLPVLGNGGLPPSLISAFTGAKIFAEFILDGGYYPEGGMQALANTLGLKFKEFGGELRTSCRVNKIVVENNQVRGIKLESGEFINSKCIVSNCDARQTFFKLLGRKIVPIDIVGKIKTMIPSLSLFILYLGIKPFETLPNAGTNVWFLPHYDIEEMYLGATRRTIHNIDAFMVRVSPDNKTILGFFNSSFKNKVFWQKNKNKFIDVLIKKIEQNVIPELSKNIVYKDAATPYTLYRYTYNFKGAAYGWASFPSQLFTPELRQKTFIKGLYLTGHWTTQTQGIPGVAYIGLNTAKLILKNRSI